MKLSLVLLCSALTVGAFGFVHKSNMAKPNVPESNPELLRKLQQYQGTRSQVGSLKRPKAAVPLPATDARAMTVVASAASFVGQTSSEQGPLNSSKAPGSPTKGPIGALALAAGGFMVFWVAGKRQSK